jgi:DNA-binding Lrp family transcriptional regulator
MPITDLQRYIINQYQGGVPLTERPYRAMAVTLGCAEDDLVDNLKFLLEEGTLTRFGPLYDAVQLGGGLTLAALSVPTSRYQEVTEKVNAFPEVAHNYRRDHNLNMWFVLATESPQQLGSTLRTISDATGLPVYDFPKQHEFYVGLWLQLDEQGLVNTIPVPSFHMINFVDCQLDTLDRAIVHHSQSGLALASNPWETIANAISSDTSEVLNRMEKLLNCGVVRRIGVVPNHYRLGLKGNGMTVWDVPDEIALEAGKRIGQLDFVSHCYLRPRHLPLWRYNLFAMVHGHDRDEVHAKSTEISELLGERCQAHDILFSSAILKKTGMRLAA